MKYASIQGTGGCGRSQNDVGTQEPLHHQLSLGSEEQFARTHNGGSNSGSVAATAYNINTPPVVSNDRPSIVA